MPRYDFQNIETGEIKEVTLKISELGAYKEANPQLKHVINSAPSIGDPVRLGRVKVDEGFKDVLRDIADRTPGGKGLRDNIR